MEEILINTYEPRKTFNFKDNNVEILTLDELKRTYKENDIMGNPLRGMYHYEILDRIQEICENNNLNIQIEEIFAAQNKSKYQAGVVINPEIEKQYCENAIEAHVLRRIYANIRVFNFDTQELTTNIALAFHQNAIQIAYGPMVKVCHNQCIMNPKRVFTTSRNNTILGVIEEFSKIMSEFSNHIDEDKEMISRMKEYPMTAQKILEIIGIFEAHAVRYYSKDGRIHCKNIYPLNMSQIGKFTENMLLKGVENNNITLWDVYNAATELYKADMTEIPSMFDQHLSLNDYIQKMLM